MHSLPLFHRIAGTRVVVVGDGEMAAAKRRLVERAGGICVGEADKHHARLAFVATENAEEADLASLRLKGQGLLVNVADRPELCDFTLPSVLERGDVLVAVSTGGASAGLAKQLRLRLEALLPSSLGKLVAALNGARDAMQTRWPDAAARRHALDGALSENGPLDPLDDSAVDRVERWLNSPNAPPAPQVIEITLRSDDPDDLTLRQARLLGMADMILCGPDVPPAILDRARADATRGHIGDAAHPNGLTLQLRMKRNHGLPG